MIEIFVPGPPQGKGRARSARLPNGKTIHYTPEKTRTYEGIIAALAMEAMKGKPPLEGPVGLTLVIKMPIPQSWPAWKRAMAAAQLIAPTTKPDADNVEKAVKDGLNGIAWRDDCQVVSVTKVKCYSRTPRVEVVVAPMDALPAQITKRPL